MTDRYPAPPPPPPHPAYGGQGYPPPPGYGQPGMQGPVYGGFWVRFVAYIIDSIILNIVVFIISFIVGLGLGAGTGGIANDTGQTIGGLLGIVIAWLYFAFQESSAAGATLGKRALGLRVLRGDGMRLSFGRATGRFFAKIISGVILLIGFIMAGFTERKRALHDMIADTVVIRA
jgi:uncharacterized RDD family membrane protein YckC